MTWTQDLAQALGAPESGLKLILGQLSGYPLFLLYRHFLMKSEAWIQHLYFALTGLFMSYWAVGEDAVMHGSICILVTWLTLKIAGGNYVTSLLLFIFNLVYLFIGYVMVATREYDITWTMPQCVLCLRLIGLSMDVWDGTKPKDKLSKDQTQAALDKVPSILECFSHTFFIGGYFVGPQFSMRKFQNFIVRNQNDASLPSPVSFGFKRLALGCLYMTIHLVGSGYVPESWITSDDYKNSTFLRASLLSWIWVKLILSKYISAWLLAEGSCIVAGLGYNGKDSTTGEIMWNGGANVKLRRYETPYKFQHLIDSFNINTNGWVASYVYKRLRFLNNKKFSQIGTLIFLAVWHGYHSGYYVTFLYEFLVMFIENDFLSSVKNLPSVEKISKHPVGNWVGKGLGFMYVQLLLPHCFAPFALLKRDRYLQVIQNSNYFMPIFFVLGFALNFGLKKLSGKKTGKKSE